MEKDYIITLKMNVIGCKNKEEAKEQFREAVNRGAFAETAWQIEELKSNA